jgi:hypothetical protein
MKAEIWINQEMMEAKFEATDASSRRNWKKMSPGLSTE